MATVSPVTEDEEVEEAFPFMKACELGGHISAGLGVLRVRMLKSESSLVAAFFRALVGV